jgi:integrase
LELSLEERSRFLAAFDDERGFRRLVHDTNAAGRLVSSAVFARPRRFGAGRRADGVATAFAYQRFRVSKPLFVVALETGLSQSDLLALAWPSVNLREGWIRVARRKTKRQAIIPISDACREALSECRRKPLVGREVFLTIEGRPYSVATINRYFKKTKKIAGIERRFRFHDLRHSFGSFLASKGISIQLIQQALGHSTVALTERYARPSVEALHAVRKALDSLREESAEEEKTGNLTVGNSNSSSNSPKGGTSPKSG